MYKKNIKKISSSILVWALSLSSFGQLLAHEVTNTYSSINVATKIQLEKRLGSFLDTIGKYEEDKQTTAYQALQNKIDLYESRFDVDSEIYTVFQMIDLIAEHKLDTQSILSDSQILSHVIYGNDFPHYAITSVIDEQETETQENTDSEEIEDGTIVSWEYRADLDTEDLNELDKNILAGTSKGILNLRVRANLEGITSETVEFRFNENIDNIGLIGKLYHDGILIWESSESDARGTVLTIDNITNFTIGTETSNVQLELVTKAIGKELVWSTLENIRVVSTTFKDNTGVITGDKVWDRTDNQNSKNFSIVPADILVSTEIEFEKYVSTANIKIIPSVGNNNENGSVFSTSLESITLQVSSFSQAWTVSIFNTNGVEVWTGTISSAWNTTIAVNSDNISSSGELYRISTTAEGTFIISQDGIWYSAGGETYASKLEKQILLGQR